VPNSWPTVVDNRFTLYGSKGCLEIPGAPAIVIAAERYRAPFSSHAITRYGKPFGHFYESIRHFADCVVLDQEPQASGHDGLMATAMIEATLRSLAKGRPVRMTEVLDG
jgi:myo-inositol 2-dehydrogenase/D-chiro-inositol 1-dehydrogenase